MTWYALSTVLAGAFVLAIAVFTFFKGRKDKPTRLFVWFCVAVAVWCFSDFGVNTSPDAGMALFWTRILHIGAVATPPLFIHFILTLTNSTSKWNVLRYVYSISFICLLLNLTPLFIHSVEPDPVRGYSSLPGPAYNLFLALFGWGAVYGFYKFIPAYRATRGLAKIQLKYILASLFIVVAGGISYFLLNIGLKDDLPPIDNVLVIIFTSIIAYAVAKYQLMDIHLAITRASVFMGVYTVLLGLPLMAAWAWQAELKGIFGTRWWVGLWFACVVLSSAAHYANQFFQRRTEARLLAEQKRYQAILRQASQGMTLIKDLRHLVRLIVHLLTRKVRLRHASIYLWDAGTRRFEMKAARQSPVQNHPRFAEQDALTEYLRWHDKPLVTEELQLRARWGEKDLQPIVDALKSMAAAVLVPSFAEKRCKGFLILGDKISGALYTSDDLQVFEVLASQAALAIENAEFYEELKRTQADLFQTAKMASLGHMAGGMSHQINNRFHVLTILAGTLKSIMKSQDPSTLDAEKLKAMWDKALETLTKLEDNALRGGDIVKTLLRFSRPSGEYKAVTVPQILQTAKEVVQFRVDMANLDLMEEIPADLPAVKGDLNQLADCCFNLLTNAYDAIMKKAGMIQEKQIQPAPDDPSPFKARIWIRAKVEKKEDQSFVVLELRDNGCGMTPEELESLFVPFFTTKATAQKGTGLGLYVIQRIIERHGGSIHASSRHGTGTTFALRVPVYGEKDSAAAKPAAEKPAPGAKASAA